jgi:predicted nucleotidyltransferase
MTDARPFEPLAVLRALSDGGVAFVLIGGVAARLHGSPSLTRDIDICYARDADNLERLVQVLRSLHARLRGVEDEVPFLLDARTLRAGANFTFVTDLGDVDILAVPPGVEGYDDLASAATEVDLDGTTVLLVSLDDLIRMKRAAGRAKDRAELEILEALRSELEK